MIILTGKSVFEGIVNGRISFYKRKEITIEKYTTDNPEVEISRFYSAKKIAKKELEQLYEESVETVGEANAMMFWIHKMILEDTNYIESVKMGILDRNINAEAAVLEAGEKLISMFSTMKDAYMQGRAADAKDVSDRMLRILSAGHNQQITLDEPMIIAADDLAPSETVQLDKEKVLSFITIHGSLNSHTAILARTMNIPAVIGCGKELKKEYDGKPAIVDGTDGKVYIEPDQETIERMNRKQREHQHQMALLTQLKGQENITRDGIRVGVYANISKIEDAQEAINNDAGGIGLFRSEFLYLEKDRLPTEEEQFLAYREIVQKMNGKRVVVRTMDIGSDKQVAYMNISKEENPAMGYRGIRICLKEPDIFKTQLRAIWRASIYGDISVMFPMIISKDEILEIKKIVKDVECELRTDGYEYCENIELGIMIETPAAALISYELAKEVDFLSVGTNDLTQYTLAIDRTNENLDDFYDAHHPALFMLIQMIADNAHKAGIRIGICGELAADMTLTKRFLDMGIRELSVAPSMVLPLRKKIREQ